MGPGRPVTVPNMTLLAVPTEGCPLRLRLGTGWPVVRPPEGAPTTLDEPPDDPTALGVPADDPPEDPPALDAGRSVAVPADDDPAGAVRPWALASSGIPSPTATIAAINVCVDLAMGPPSGKTNQTVQCNSNDSTGRSRS